MKPLSKAAQTCLARMYQKHKSITTQMVIQEAKKKTSPLHSEFEWDIKAAAAEHWKWTARRLIMRYNVKIEEPGEKFMHVPAIKPNTPGKYKKAKVIVKTISEFERAMDEAIKTLTAAKNAVQVLENAATLEEEDDRLALLGIALKSIDTAENAIRKLH